jgi:hypothetical protein
VPVSFALSLNIGGCGQGLRSRVRHFTQHSSAMKSLILTTLALTSATTVHAAATSKCLDADGKPLTAPKSDGGHDHGAHNHRLRSLEDDNHDHGAHDHDLVYMVRQAKCGDWVPLIQNYTAKIGTMGGTYVRVFSDGTTTAQVDAVIMRKGHNDTTPRHLANTKVMGHLHVGACTEKTVPAFVNGVRASTVGAHWKDAKDQELHYMFSTGKKGESTSMTCPSYEVDRTALSVVLHESDTGAVVGMNAKKLCCDLTWDAKDIVKQGSTGSMTTGSMFVAAMMSLVVAMLV